MPTDELKKLSRKLVKQQASSLVSVKGLANVLEQATTRRFNNDDPVCIEGEPGDAMYFLIEGRIRVMRKAPSGKMQELTLLKPPAMFGHMALVDNSPRSASCIAHGKVVTLALDRSAYNRLLDAPSPIGISLRRMLMSSMAHQLSMGNERLRELIYRPGGPLPSMSTTRDVLSGLPSLSNAEETAEETAGEEDDISDKELMEVAGMLEGWSVDLSSLEDMEVVYDESTKATTKKRPY